MLNEPISMTKEGEFRVARSAVSGNKIRFQVGWSIEGAEGSIFEPLQEELLK
jgi:hypothetical protein